MSCMRTLRRFLSTSSNASISSSPGNLVHVHRLGRMDFLRAFQLQQELMSNDGDHLLFVEHPCVYTCGRRHFKDLDNYINCHDSHFDANTEHVQRFKNEILKINRGGNVTFHGDGQLVIYPIFDLRKPHFRKDLYWYLRTIEDVIIDLLLNEYNVKTKHNFDCYHDPTYTGVWLKNNSEIEYKICAIGIGVTRWRTFHGASLNINASLQAFDKIIPCGIHESNKGVINLLDIIGDAHMPQQNTSSLTDTTSNEFNGFANEIISKLTYLFAKHFNVKCVEV